MRIIAGILALMLLGAGFAIADNARSTLSYVAICAASQGLVQGQMNESPFKQVILADAQWFHKNAVRLGKEIGVDGEEEVFLAMKELQSGYNSGAMSWDEIVDSAQSCSEWKLEIERRAQ